MIAMTHSTSSHGRRTTRVLRSILYLTLILCTATAASAQEFGRIQEQVAAGTAYRVFARPGDATVQVVVVADDGSGVYEVAADTDLGGALSRALKASRFKGGAGETLDLVAPAASGPSDSGAPPAPS